MRQSLNMILEGQETGALTHDKILMDSTSGNTGIAYAMIGAALGYRVKLCVPKNIALIRQRILTAYGAELVFTDATRGSDGAQEEAIRLYAEDPTRDLRALPTLLAVVARGRLYSKEVLDQAVEDALAHFHGFPYEPLSMAAASVGLSWLDGQDE